MDNGACALTNQLSDVVTHFVEIVTNRTVYDNVFGEYNQRLQLMGLFISYVSNIQRLPTSCHIKKYIYTEGCVGNY